MSESRQKAKQNRKQTNQKRAAKPERGTLLSLALIFVMIHGLLLLLLIFIDREMYATVLPTWLILGGVAIAIADIVAGIALWNWKGWGFFLYMVATLGALFLGLSLTGSLLFAFSRIIPFAIVGYIMRPKWHYFEGLMR